MAAGCVGTDHFGIGAVELVRKRRSGEVSFSGISVVESLGECRGSRDRYDSVVELEWVDSSSAEVFD